jgi:hypothetical protein
MISRNFRIAVKLSELPAWRLAMNAGINPNVLSKIMSGALRVKPGDERVIKIGRAVGLNPEECFSEQTLVEGNNGNM